MSEDLIARLSDPWWRLNNLYRIKDKQGKVQLFKPNDVQRELYNNMWYLNCVLKARQRGVTTFVQLFILDRCLFNDNVNAGVIAHNKEDAEDFFTDKIKFAYDNLPSELRALRTAVSDTTRQLKFSNGSQIRVGTSLRSGTYQYLHISEFGKMCAKYPEKAAEVIAGALNTVAPGQFIFVESTAEGPHGEFYDMCKQSESLTEIAIANDDRPLTKMDYRFFFFPWWTSPDYVLHERVEINAKFETYFRELAIREGIELRAEQKAWYVKKAEEQGDKMKQEYPSTSAEAFERTVQGAIYGEQLRRARAAGRITKVAIERGIPVNTFWDLGRNDMNAIWFHQHVGTHNHFIYYLEDRLVDLTYYVEKLRELKELYGWNYGRHYLPHDVEVTDLSARDNAPRRTILAQAGLNPIETVPRIRNLNDGIEMTRRIFDTCWFDEEGCEIGLRALAGYEYIWDAQYSTYRKLPSDNWAKNGADAFRQFAQGFRGPRATFQEQLSVASGGAAGREYRKNRKPEHNPVFNPDIRHVV